MLAGGAATLAARDVKQKILRASAHLLEAGVEDIEIANGVISVIGTDRALTFRQMARAVYSEMGRVPADQREELGSTQTYDPVFGTSATAAHLAVVEIEPRKLSGEGSNGSSSRKIAAG